LPTAAPQPTSQGGASGSSGSNGAGGKKGKKGKQSFNDFVQATKVHPQVGGWATMLLQRYYGGGHGWLAGCCLCR
jgi:hypothetical protein